MPIQISPISSFSYLPLKNALEKLARESFSLQNVSQSGSGVLTSMPSAANVEELQAVFVNDGGTRKIVVKLDGVRYAVSLTAV